MQKCRVKKGKNKLKYENICFLAWPRDQHKVLKFQPSYWKQPGKSSYPNADSDSFAPNKIKVDLITLVR